MKIGVRAHDFGQMSPEELAAVLHQHGYNAAQLAVTKGISGCATYQAMTEELASAIRTAFDRAEVEITVLGCYIDMSNPDSEIQKNHMAEFFAAMKQVGPMGARMIGSETSYGNIPMEQKIATWPLVLKHMDQIMNRAETLDVDVAIEPVAFHTLYSPEWTRRLLDTIDSRHLKIIFDPLNMLVPERVREQNAVWKECFDAFGEEIAAVHIKDCHFGAQGVYHPCQLGKGITDYGYLFEWLKAHKPEISILREEEERAYAKEDVAFLLNLLFR